MTRRSSWALAWGLCAVAWCGTLFGCRCGEPEPTKAPAAVATTLAPAAQATASASADLSDLPVPTEEDFEEAAEREITIDNLESELDRMEKEIGQ